MDVRVASQVSEQFKSEDLGSFKKIPGKTEIDITAQPTTQKVNCDEKLQKSAPKHSIEKRYSSNLHLLNKFYNNYRLNVSLSNYHCLYKYHQFCTIYLQKRS